MKNWPSVASASVVRSRAGGRLTPGSAFREPSERRSPHLARWFPFLERAGLKTVAPIHRFSILMLGLVFCATSVLAQPTPTAGTSSSSGTAASEGWTSLVEMQPPSWDGKELIFHGTRGTLAVVPVSADIIRIRLTTRPAFGWDHSYAVVHPHRDTVSVKTQIRTAAASLRTRSLRVTVQYAPFRITFQDPQGEVLDADVPTNAIALNGSAFRVSKRLRADDHVYGFGEKTGRLDKRGWRLGGYNYVMWNTDTPAYDSSTDPLYVSVPFYLVVRHGRAHGIFLDNTGRSFFDIGREQPGRLIFGAEGGDLNYYFINGPTPKQVVERYTSLTGHMPLPPLWSLGYQQCRWSYYPESRVRLLADTFRSKQVPADGIWLDIHYQNGYKPFTWDLHRFPHPKKMIGDLRAQGFHVVCIVDPHPQAEKGYAPYDSGLAGNHFVKWPDGRIYEGPVWPSQAEKNPGPSAFPDFTQPSARKWWGSLCRGLVNDGVAGIWNDMDEPSVFDQPTGTMPLNLVFNNDDHPTTHRAIHNVYGQLMSRSTYEGLRRLRPHERPFVLTRSSYAGGQRYAAVWTGDNTADWSSLRQAVSMLLGMGLSGFPFVGSDIGGFVRTPSGELYARWLQTAVFFPFMRSHTELGTPDQEPWSFGNRYEAINKRTIELRYELLPYIYNVMHEASETGLPAMRPLFLEFPNEDRTASIDDEFMFGSGLLAAPVLWQGVTERSVYLPPGDWYDYWTGRHYSGNTTIQVPVSLDSFPLFVRGGAFIFRQPIVQNTDQMPAKALRVLIAPARKSESSFYEDDGESFRYLRGDFMKRKFHQLRKDRTVTFEVSAPTGHYRPASRSLVLQTWMNRRPRSVSELRGSSTQPATPLPRRSATELAKSARGWSYTNGLVAIKEQDPFQPVRFTLQR